MKELSLLAACATLALAGSALLPSEAKAQECLPELSPDAPPPNPEDNCDEVGNPEEGGTDNPGHGEPNFPPAPPPPPPPPPPELARAGSLDTIGLSA